MHLLRSMVGSVIAILTVATVTWAQTSSAPSPDEVVQLDTVQVSGRSLHIGWHAHVRANKKTDIISSFTFTQIDRGSLAEKAGLKVGDRLIAIDGHLVIGITIEEYLKLLKRTLNPGETVTYALTIQRGFFRKESVVKIDVTL